MRLIFRKISVLALLGVFCLSSAGLAGAEELNADTILQQVKQKWSGSQSMQTDVTISVQMAGMPLKIDGIMWQKAKLFRAEMTIPPEVISGSTAAGAPVAPFKILMVFDGKFMWQQFSMMNMVTKVDMSAVESKLPAGSLRPKAFFGAGALPDNVTYLASAATRNGKDYYRLEVKDADQFARSIFPAGMAVNVPARMNLQKAVIWVGRDSLFPEILELYTTTDKPMLTMEFKNVKANPDLSPDLFIFNVPKDVKPVDMTPMVLNQLQAATRTDSPPVANPPAAGK